MLLNFWAIQKETIYINYETFHHIFHRNQIYLFHCTFELQMRLQFC